MGHFHYNVTSTIINKGLEDESNTIYHEKYDDCMPPKPEKLPGWKHVNPISTLIDLDSVAFLLSHYKYGSVNVTKDDLLNPAPEEYYPGDID